MFYWLYRTFFGGDKPADKKPSEEGDKKPAARQTRSKKTTTPGLSTPSGDDAAQKRKRTASVGKARAAKKAKAETKEKEAVKPEKTAPRSAAKKASSPKKKGADGKWDAMYEKAVEFRTKFGHCRIPANYEDKDLCVWARNQRSQWAKKQKGQKSVTLTDEREERLNDIGFTWKGQRGRPRHSDVFSPDAAGLASAKKKK